MNNSDLIVRTLESTGVRWVFGIPSGPVLPLIEALRFAAENPESDRNKTGPQRVEALLRELRTKPENQTPGGRDADG